jgi:hypothetical protein
MKNVITREDVAVGDIAKNDINEYIDKKARKRRRKKFDVVYICRNGKYKKFKIPHDYAQENIEDDPILAGVVERENEATQPKTKKEKDAESKSALKDRKKYLKQKAAKWKHRGHRIDGRRLRTINGMSRCMAYIMPERSDASNTYADSFDITEADRYCRMKIKEGMKSFSMLHVFLAAYVRVVSQRPGINRFISGQEIYSRYSIDVVMTVKKTMSLDSADTCIKVYFEPTDTIDEIYHKFNKVVAESTGDNADTGFDSLSGALLKLPRWLFRLFVWLLNKLDYHGRLPLSLLEVSPFHGSMIITSMGSLGIKPIYHHIYNFGNLPIFLSYGKKRYETVYGDDGTISRRKYMDLKVVTDERICDGFYYASAFKLMKKYIENPEMLELPPEKVFEDIE